MKIRIILSKHYWVLSLSFKLYFAFEITSVEINSKWGTISAKRSQDCEGGCVPGAGEGAGVRYRHDGLRWCAELLQVRTSLIEETTKEYTSKLTGGLHQSKSKQKGARAWVPAHPKKTLEKNVGKFPKMWCNDMKGMIILIASIEVED